MTLPRSEHPLRSATLNCPNCGAAASPDSPQCAYCHSTLAAKICAGCFGAVFHGMKHCPWCGTEAGSALPRTSDGLKCPRCSDWLARVEVHLLPLGECLRCGGLWVDNKTVQRVCEQAEEQEAVLALNPGPQAPPSSGQAPARAYIPCPACGKLMNRDNFAGCSGVVVDRCKVHGTWFDRDELRRVVEFIRGGGMRKSREREKESLREETQRLKDQQRNLAALARMDGSVNSGSHSEIDTLLRLLGSLSG